MFQIRACARTKCGRNAALVQEIAAVALVTNDNFLPKIFNNLLCGMSNYDGNRQQTS